ncbi:uncharacterized protein [Asterias amurensis]|uniref:uncharacterized protein n=1 Tax=Asterias amurensis TaxID=7602 RepID=UPI003AB5077C
MAELSYSVLVVCMLGLVHIIASTDQETCDKELPESCCAGKEVPTASPPEWPSSQSPAGGSEANINATLCVLYRQVNCLVCNHPYQPKASKCCITATDETNDTMIGGPLPFNEYLIGKYRTLDRGTNGFYLYPKHEEQSSYYDDRTPTANGRSGLALQAGKRLDGCEAASFNDDKDCWTQTVNVIALGHVLYEKHPYAGFLYVVGHKFPADCQALLDAGNNDNGIYTIHSFQNNEGIKVLCDMTNHTGWIVVQRRYNGSVSFNRSWAEYKKGFGSMDGEFWLGNEILHELTDAEGNWTIRLDLTNEDNMTGHLLKKQFHVGPGDYTLFLEHSGIQQSVGRHCGHKLGMEDGSIPDDKITASSHWNSNYLPSNARLNMNGCWGPAENQGSWLQIMYMGLEPVHIEGVITQGNPDGYYWTTHYQVQYSIDGTAWLYVNEASTPQTFIGNTDGNTPVTNIFQQPIQARYIRIRPTAWNNSPTLRIELLGCRAHEVCQQKLGMGDGTIPDGSITTSSTDDQYCSWNTYGRLDLYGGWCPTLNDTDSAWFQVDLHHPVLIQGVVTQANFYKGFWVTEFIVSYGDTEQDMRFIGGAEKDNAQRFSGNTDMNTKVTTMFNEGIRARYIRIIPTGYYTTSGFSTRPGLRVELLGCNERFFCLNRLGMGDGSIPDYRITASSTQQREDGNCQPSNARLTQSANSDTIGWCPDPNDINPWLQIDLESNVIVEGIMMLQGSDQVINEDVSHGYRLEYSDDQNTWHTKGSAQIIRRNTAADSVATSMFNPPISARYIRIILNQTDGSLWIRVELLGCKVRWVCGQRLLKEAHIIPDESPQLQIDLLLVTLVEGVIAQGESEPSFQVEYSLDNVTWVYLSHQGAPEKEPQIFHGNTNQTAPVTIMFQQPIRARFILVTQTDIGYPAVSIELIGCRNDILETANNQAFSIHHRTDNNQNDTNCPGLNSEGGWWFNRCSGIPGVDNNLNAEYIQPGDTKGPYKRVIRATEWNGSRIVKTEIKIRRQSPPRG